MFVFIGIDGLSSALMQQEIAHLPHLHSLLNASAYTYHAMSEVPTKSGINWGTHFFGHTAAYHCWYDNDKASACSGAHSIFDTVNNSSGYAPWTGLQQHIPAFRTTADDVDTAHKIARHVQKRDRQLVAAVLNGLDNKGDQIAQALREADDLVGLMLRNVTSQDHVLFVSDHGTRTCAWWQFTCLDHYGTMPVELETPMMLKGPGVTPGLLRRRVTHQDSSYYILDALNYTMPCDWQLGKHNSCDSAWPGHTTHVELAEELFRNAANVAILVMFPVTLLLFGTVVVLLAKWPRSRTATPRPCSDAALRFTELRPGLARLRL